MYNNKTTDLMKIIIKIGYVLVALVGVVLWVFVNIQRLNAYTPEEVKLLKQIVLLAGSYTAVIPAGYVALINIDKLLSNVKNDSIFEASTIKYLDKICYACVFASVVGLISFALLFILKIEQLYIFYPVIASAELFMALVLKVIKNVFTKAIDIKNENDLTI